MIKPKHVLLLLLTLCMAHTTAMAQKSADDNDETGYYLEGAVPEVDGKVVFSKEFSIPGLSQEQIYDRISKWMAKRLEQNNNDKSRVVYTEGQSIVAGAGEEWLVFKSNALSLDKAWMGYSLKANCENESCTLTFERIKYRYQEKEHYTAEEMISDANALNKSKTKMILGLRKWRVKTVNFANDLFDTAAKALATDEEQAAKEAEEKAAAQAAAASKPKKGPVVINTVSVNSAVPASQTQLQETALEAQPVEKADAANGVEAVAPAEMAVAPVATVASSAEMAKSAPTLAGGIKEVSPEDVSKDAINISEGKLVIVISEDEFNVSMMTAKAGGSIGRVNDKPVVFSILSPDQAYETLEKAETYKVRFYPTGATTPSLELDCKKIEGPAAFEGQPRTYIGEIVKAYQ